MDSAVWSSVVTAVATLTGVGLTQRHASTLRRQDRHEERRVEQRQALADVLVAGREWTSSLDGLLLVAGMLGDPVEFGKSLAVDTHGPINAVYRRALVTARLVVRDKRVLAYVTRLSELMDAMPEHISAVHTSAKSHGKAKVEVLGAALGQASAYAKALDGLEQLTRERVIDDPPTLGWRTRLRRRLGNTSEQTNVSRPLPPWRRRARVPER